MSRLSCFIVNGFRELLVDNQISFENGISYYIIELLHSYYQELLSNALMIIIGVVLLTVGISLLLRIRNIDRAYISKTATPLSYHYSLIVFSLLMVIYRGYTINSGAPILLSAITCVLGIVLCYCLIKWKWWYAIVLPGFHILFFGVDVIWRVEEILSDYDYAITEPVPSGLFYYAWDSYLFSKLFVELIFLTLVYLYSLAYYNDRRVFFETGPNRLYSNLSSCPRCGALKISKTKYCYSCGYSVDDISGSVLNIDDILDVVKYCPKCGAQMDGSNKCSVCNGNNVSEESETVKKVAEEAARNAFSDMLGNAKTKILVGVLIAIFLFPALYGGTVKKLTDGSAAANNNYVETVNMAYNDFSIVGNPDWIQSIESSAGELNDVNSRIYQIDLNKISYTDLYYFYHYSRATYLQMWIMSLISDAVHEKNESLFLEYLSYYNTTIQMQTDAAYSSVLFAKNQSKLEIAKNAITDAVRFYVSFIGLNIP